MLEEFYCPACEAALGEPGPFCWKCGLPFGPNASNKPRRRIKETERPFSVLRAAGIMLAPTLLYWLAANFYHPVARSFPLLYSFPGFQMLGLIGFGFTCTWICVAKLAQAERGAAWLLGAMCFAAVMFWNLLALFRAILIIGA